MSGKAYSNIVKKKQIRDVQQWTLNALKEALIPSAGCYGSTTQILIGDPEKGLIPQYSKDGHTILSNIHFNRALEEAIRRECTEMTRYIVKEVGDGTTSAVILSSLIFNELCKLDEKYPPYLIVQQFQKIANSIKDEIKNNGRDLTLDDIYKIAMICTNNNERVSKTLEDIYREHGLDVFIDVAASTTDHDVIKSYDGLTLGVGYSDPVYINTRATKATDEKAGYSIINDARVYAFKDPIDTMEMTNFFNAIISKNIIRPINDYATTKDKKYLDKIVPTVIMCPKISVDLNTSFTDIVDFMYSFNNNLSAKPPLLIITNIGETNFETYSDIWKLCNCKLIQKYIDPEIQKKDQEEGKAPTMDNIEDFCGRAKQVKADAYKTTFLEPIGMFALDDDGEIQKDEEGNAIYSENYKGQLAFLEQELKVALDSNETIDVVGNLRRRIHALKANMVDYFVGGVNVTDRDSVRDLVEDAVKNIRSAAVDGVGYGTNFEGLRATKEIGGRTVAESDLDVALWNAINAAYIKMSRILYSTVYNKDGLDVDELINKSLEEGTPMNFTNGEFDGTVLCTIKQDIVILDVISKIITIMFTTNQGLVQNAQYNMYIAEEDM
jgi:hypothetical protein